MPLYQGQLLFVVAMGCFSISEKMSKAAKRKHGDLLGKVNRRICEMCREESDLDVQIGVVLLAFEMDIEDVGISLLGIVQESLVEDFSKIDPYKVWLLLIAVVK